MNKPHLFPVPSQAPRESAAEVNVIKINEFVSHEADAGGNVKWTGKGKFCTEDVVKRRAGLFTQTDEHFEES